jgi:phage baseplate assembly protein W
MDERKEWLGRGFGYPLRLDMATGAVAMASYEEDVREALRILVETSPGERVMRPDFGCGIRDLAFALVDVSTITRIETMVREAIVRYEPRVELIDIRIDPLQAADGLLLIEVAYRIRRTNQTDNMVYPFFFRESGVGIVEDSR